MKTGWWCERCHASGVVTHAKHVGAYEIIEAIRRSHDTQGLAKWTRCDYSHDKVRVRELIGEPEAADAVARTAHRVTGRERA